MLDPMDTTTNAKSVEYRPGFLERLTHKLFPYNFPKDLPSRGGAMPGWMATKMTVRLGWADRLRAMVTGRMVIEMRQQTDTMVSHVDSEAAVSFKAPWSE